VKTHRAVRLSARSVMRRTLAASSLALALLVVALTLRVPEPTVRVWRPRLVGAVVSSKAASPKAAGCLVTLAPVASATAGLATSASTTGTLVEREAPREEPADPVARATAASARAAVAATVASTDTATRVLLAILDPMAPPALDRLVVRGRVQWTESDATRPYLGATVTLLATLPDTSQAPLEGEALAAVIAGIAPERRYVFSEALGSDPRRTVFEVATTRTDAEGYYIFAISRWAFPDDTYLYATARAVHGGVTLAGATQGRESLPDLPRPSDATPSPLQDRQLDTITLEATARVSLVVRANGHAVADAQVALDRDNVQGTTDSRGFFAVDARASSTITVSKPGWAIQNISIESPSQTSFEVNLVPELPVKIRIVDGSGRPVAGASAYAVSAADMDENGGGILRGLGPEGSFSVTASAPSGVPLLSKTVSFDTPCEEVVVVLDPAVTIHVVLALEPGLPRRVANAGVECHLDMKNPDTGDWVQQQNTTFNNGACTFEQLAAGTYRVWTVGSQEDDHLALGLSGPLVLAGGDAPDVAIDQGHGRLVHAWVSDENGNALNAEVTLAETGVKINASNKGWFELRLPRQEIHLNVHATSGSFEDAHLVLTKDDTALPEIVLRSQADPSR
jgi:hypothetical protein